MRKPFHFSTLLTIVFLLNLLHCNFNDKQKINSTEAKIDSIIALMTLEEKIDLCHANSKFTIPGVPRLGIPELDMTDGPHSIKYEFDRNS